MHEDDRLAMGADLDRTKDARPACGKFTRRVLSYNHLPWYPGKETRNPPPTMAIGTGMNINVADLDRDGKVDIVVAGKSGLYLFENRGLPPTKRMQ